MPTHIKRRPIESAERAHWSELGHLLILQALADSCEWTNEQFAFHGGTSLHLSWNSPRFSEDLDFLLEATAAKRLDAVISAAADRMRQMLALVDPDLEVEIKDKSNSRMGHYQFVLGKQAVMGKVMIKVEFWNVPPSYLKGYETQSRTPAIPLDLGGVRLRIDAMLPAATLASALADKLTAFATRPHLKWRDIFDLWWIQRQATFVPPSNEELLAKFFHHVSAYRCTRPGDPAGSLRDFADRISDSRVIEEANNDLRPFLPEALWRSIWPTEVESMVHAAAQYARHLAWLIEEHEGQGEVASPSIGRAEVPRT